MKLLLCLVLAFSSGIAHAQYSLLDVHDQIKSSQLEDDRFDWKYFGTLNYKVDGIDNAGEYRLNIQENVQVRMYLVSKTECIIYFTARNYDKEYLFGTEDTESLRTILMGGHKVATAIHNFGDAETMVVRFGVRWGCEKMINTEMKLLVFYKEN